jgi:hypothetical protein
MEETFSAAHEAIYAAIKAMPDVFEKERGLNIEKQGAGTPENEREDKEGVSETGKGGGGARGNQCHA